MKKFVMVAAVIMAMSGISPMLPQAHAAVLDEVLAQAVAQHPSAATIQELLAVKQDLEQGNKQAVAGYLARTALQKAGRGDVAAVLASGGDVNALAQTALRQAVQQRYGEKIATYESGLRLLSTLFGHSSLSPQAAQDNNSLAGAPQNYRRMLQMTATAYGPGPQDNGRWNDMTYVGGKVAKGVVAVDPRVIPLGSKLWVEGYGQAVAADTGSAIKGNRVDLAFNTRQEALDYGIKPVKVYVLN
jgi:3D (Asp-Asp-Asp) domain-containing protein